MSRARLIYSDVFNRMSSIQQLDEIIHPNLNMSHDKVFNLCFNESSNGENSDVSAVLSEMNTSMDDWLRHKTSMDCTDNSYFNDINFLSTRDDMCSSDVGLELILVNNEKKESNLNYCRVNDKSAEDMDYADPLLNLASMNEVLLRKTDTKCDILDGSDAKIKSVWDTLSIASRKSDCEENNTDFADFHLLPLNFDVNETENDHAEVVVDHLSTETESSITNETVNDTQITVQNSLPTETIITPFSKSKKLIQIKLPNILRTNVSKIKSSSGSTETTNSNLLNVIAEPVFEHNNVSEILAKETITASNSENEISKAVNEVNKTEEKEKNISEDRIVRDMLTVLGIADEALDSIVTDEGIRMWMCPEQDCDRIFNRPHTLKTHILSHYVLKPFKCDFPDCPWSFYTSFKLKRHRETHLKRKDFTCTVPNCNRSFTTVYNLNTHLKLHERPARLKCLVRSCSAKFQTRRAMETHLKTHELSLAPYKCSTSGCTKLYFSLGALTAHMRVHQHKDEELRCHWDNCGRVFDKPCRLRAHMRIHTGDKPYVCKYQDCQWAFASSSKLKRHQYKHNNERRFRCTIGDCTKAFMRSEHLREHTFTHIAQRTFQCSVCGEKCSAKATLYVHKKKFHSNSTANTNNNSNSAVIEDVKAKTLKKQSPANKSCARTYMPYTDKTSSSATTVVVNDEDVMLSSASDAQQTIYLSNLMIRDTNEVSETATVVNNETYPADGGTAEYILLFDSTSSTSFPESTVNLKDLD